MQIKERPNHAIYVQALRRMTPEQRLAKAFELSETCKQLFLDGLRRRFPAKSEDEIRAIYVKRVLLCHNRNW